MSADQAVEMEKLGGHRPPLPPIVSHIPSSGGEEDSCLPGDVKPAQSPTEKKASSWLPAWGVPLLPGMLTPAGPKGTRYNRVIR